MASVVIMRPATDAASWRATRTTLAGSTMPAFSISTYCSVCASKPKGCEGLADPLGGDGKVGRLIASLRASAGRQREGDDGIAERAAQSGMAAGSHDHELPTSGDVAHRRCLTACRQRRLPKFLACRDVEGAQLVVA